jgi:DNA-binding GntR family transcriptional regulator
VIQAYKTKKDVVYEILKEEIYEGKHKPGEKLVISHLAKHFQTSESPVREAMNQLISEGLIESTPHTGAVVSTLSPKEIQNIFELRIELEGLATRLAVEHLDENDFKEMRNILAESDRAFENKDYKSIEELNIKYHMTIYNKCENELLIKMIKDLWSNTNRYPSLFKRNDGHIERSIQEHKELYAALLEKDGAQAENIMIQHKASAGKEILRLTQHKFYNI